MDLLLGPTPRRSLLRCSSTARSSLDIFTEISKKFVAKPICDESFELSGGKWKKIENGRDSSEYFQDKRDKIIQFLDAFSTLYAYSRAVRHEFAHVAGPIDIMSNKIVDHVESQLDLIVKF